MGGRRRRCLCKRQKWRRLYEADELLGGTELVQIQRVTVRSARVDT